MEKTINIGGRLHNPAVGGSVAGADEIKDDTKGKMQNVINQETDAELVRLDEAKQEKLTFDQIPTEGSTNPVTSGGVHAADAALQQAIEAILLLIPSAASALNQLADKSFVNSSISTATATFRGTYNLVTDLELTVSATHQQIATTLASVVSTADNNDYCFVQIPVSDQSTDIRVTERYKFNGTSWSYEYDLNNSGFTADQWAAINSGITSVLVSKLGALPTAAELAVMFAGKQNTLTFDSTPVAGSDNPVKSSGLYNAFAVINAMIPEGADANNKLVAESRLVAYVTTLINALDATFDVTSADGHVTLRMTQADGVITSVQILTSDIASDAALTTLGGRVSTAEADIDALQEAYAALTQSDVVIVEGALPSSGQQQNIIYRQPDQDHTPPQFYSDYMWNGTTWVLMATYMNAIDPRPKKGSQNLVTSGGVFDNMGALDVSELNATENPHTLATYADLSAALAAIPSDYQKGGMSFKFVLTSDNKYVQYFLTKNVWSASEADWEKINLEEEVFNIKSKTIGYSLDGNSLTDGYWDWTNLNVGDTAPASMEGGMNVFVGGVFPIKGGVQLTIKGNCGGSSANFLYVLTDADRKITKKSAYTSAVTEFTETPSVDGYIYITNLIAAISDFKLIEADRIASVETLSTQNSVDIESLKRIQITQWSKNLFNPNDKELADGKFLGDDGNLYTNAALLVTGYIPLTKEMGKLQSSVNGSKNVNGGYIWLYDKDFNRVNGYAANTAVQGCATWETDVAFVRFSIIKGDNIQVERGNVVTEYVPYGKFIANEAIDNKIQLDSAIIRKGESNVKASMPNGSYIWMSDDTPRNLHRNNVITFEADITDFGNGVRFAKGGQDNGANYFDVDATNIIWTQFKDGNTTIKGTYPHGLGSPTQFLKIVVIEGDGKLTIILQTYSGTFIQEVDNFNYNFNGQVYTISHGTFTNAKITWANSYLRNSIWMFGDSYFGMETEQRELYWLREWDCLDVLVDSMAGINSQKSYEELQRCLSFGTPKKLVWCLGMNDGSDTNEDTPTTSWSHYIELIEEICKKNNIELILATIPNVPAINNEGKNKWVRESGYRYIDVASAVGANVFESGVATWYGESGGAQYLEGSSNPNNRIHPTRVGAKVIATQFLMDFPDIKG